MSSKADLTTVTDERTEVEVTTETVTRYECPVCEQVVGDEELSNVTVADTETAICDYCAESVFGIDGDGEAFDAGAAIGDAADGVREKLVGPLAHLGFKLTGFLIPLYVGVQVFQEATAALDAAAFEAAAEPALLTSVFDLSPFFLMGMIVVLVFRMMAIGQRGI